MSYRHEGTVRRGMQTSGCGQYRYKLTFTWKTQTRRTLVVIGMKANYRDNLVDSKIVEAWQQCAEKNGCDKLDMLNLFAFEGEGFRAGRSNDLLALATKRDRFREERIVVAAWGDEGSDVPECASAVETIRCCYDIYCAGIELSGAPVEVPTGSLFLWADSLL